MYRIETFRGYALKQSTKTSLISARLMINAIRREGWSETYQWANIYTIDPFTTNKILTIRAFMHDGTLILTDDNGKELKRE